MRLIDGLGEVSQYYWERGSPLSATPRIWRHYEKDVVREGERFGMRGLVAGFMDGQIPESTTGERSGFREIGDESN
jgi:hypothetical protein